MDPDLSVCNEKGVALLLALVTIGFLSVVTIMLLNDVDRQLEDAATLQEIVKLDAAIASGLSLVQAALYTDGKASEYDSYHESWGRFEPEQVTSLVGEDISLEIKVEDLSGRLQVNALIEQKEEQKAGQDDTLREGETQENAEGQQDLTPSEKQVLLWRRFLLSGKFAVESEQQVEEILDTLRDWLDEDDEPRPYGAETGYYRSLSPPYGSRNGNVRSVEELLLVKGITHEILNGDEEHEGISQYITSVGTDGKININTSPKQVLQVLAPELSEEMTEDMITFRDEPDNAGLLEKIDWYRQVNSIPGDVSFDEKIVSVTANGFRLELNAEASGVVRTAEGILIREKNGEQSLMQWRIQ